MLNFIKVFILVAIAILAHVITQKFVAKKHSCDANYDVWRVKQFWFRTGFHFPITLNLLIKKVKIHAIPIGVILPVLVVILANGPIIGKIFFVAAGITLVSTNPSYRLGRKFARFTEYENAKIILAGPFANLLLAVIFKILGGSLNIFNEFIIINSWLAISTMFPLPSLDGFQVYFSSRTLYVFSFAFIIFSVILLNYLGVISTLMLALLFAIIVVIFFYYYRVYR